MKQTIIIILLFVSTRTLFGQNLVPNSSFENISSCPFSFSEIYRATPWFQPCFGYTTNLTMGSTSDFFSSCSSSNYAHTPDNNQGFQIPRTDSSYAGIILYNPLDIDYREYIEVELDTSLIANKIYCIEFYVSRANYSEYAIGNIGAYFSIDSLTDTTIYKTIDHVIPQFEYSGSLITDTSNWVLISGSFVASGGEKFMTIGNFRNDSNTNYAFLGGGLSYSYYYIDDVSLTKCGSLGIDDLTSRFVKTYPNPSTNGITIEIQNPHSDQCELTLYNSFGQIIRTFKNVTTNNFYVDKALLPNGIYYFQIMNKKSKIGEGKIIFE